MGASLTWIVKEALKTDALTFVRVVDEATRLLREEDGKLGNLQIVGRLVRIKPAGEALVIGDLHGDLESLVHILRASAALERMEKSGSIYVIFLGDYGDRGEFSAEVFYTVLKLKLHYPSQIILMRGNHEGPNDLLASPHDLPIHFQVRFGKFWNEPYQAVLGLFPFLYTAVLVQDRFLMVHGGLPKQARTIHDFTYAHENHPEQRLLEDILWSDPEDSHKGIYPSSRGAGHMFGRDVTTKVLKALNVPILIRGHEPSNSGFKIDHEGMVLTLFSRKGPPYFNMSAAFLDVKISEEFTKADQLVPFIHSF